ncbi:uncharacterized protein LOC143218026 isoform X3 [Lasioglossum baleicum]|uniref:uncharacterized protein LOC143218026 isoform X3 n=1 Tax=Lasioglossum baleicum TaxID=434251 RepID=UPI003FCD35F7
MRAARNTHAPSNGDKWTGETRGTPSAERGQTDTGARHGANGNNRSVVIEWEMPGKMVGPSPTSLWLPRNRTADDDDDDDDARRHAAQWIRFITEKIPLLRNDVLENLLKIKRPISFLYEECISIKEGI